MTISAGKGDLAPDGLLADDDFVNFTIMHGGVPGLVAELETVLANCFFASLAPHLEETFVGVSKSMIQVEYVREVRGVRQDGLVLPSLMRHIAGVLQIKFGSRILERAIELLQLAVALVELDEDGHFAAQDLRNDRYRNVVDGSDLITLELIKDRYLKAGNKNNGRPLEARVPANEPCYFESVHVRHVDIEQYGSEVLL